MMMATTAAHWRIKILDFGGDGGRWHREADGQDLVE